MTLEELIVGTYVYDLVDIDLGIGKVVENGKSKFVWPVTVKFKDVEQIYNIYNIDDLVDMETYNKYVLL